MYYDHASNIIAFYLSIIDFVNQHDDIEQWINIIFLYFIGSIKNILEYLEIHCSTVVAVTTIIQYNIIMYIY